MNLTHSLARVTLADAERSLGKFHPSTPTESQPMQVDSQTYTTMDYTYNPYTNARSSNTAQSSSVSSTLLKDHRDGMAIAPTENKKLNWDVTELRRDLPSSQTSMPIPQTSADTGFMSDLWDEFSDLKWYEQAALVSLGLPFLVAGGIEVGAALGIGELATLATGEAGVVGELVEVGPEIGSWLSDVGGQLVQGGDFIGQEIQQVGGVFGDAIEEYQSARSYLDEVLSQRSANLARYGNEVSAVAESANDLLASAQNVAGRSSGWVNQGLAGVWDVVEDGLSAIGIREGFGSDIYQAGSDIFNYRF